jgi:hypothetical protein
MIQPMKVAGIITAVSVIYVKDIISDGLWLAITVVMIQNESTATCFLSSYNRLEGKILNYII